MFGSLKLEIGGFEFPTIKFKALNAIPIWQLIMSKIKVILHILDLCEGSKLFTFFSFATIKSSSNHEQILLL